MPLFPSPSPSETLTAWAPQPGPQLNAIELDDVDELLYGGAVFGGKSDFLLGDFAQDVPRWYGAHWHGILFRKSYKQLEDLISRSKAIYPQWFPGARWTGSSKEIEKAWIWPNGATLRMRHMDHTDDWQEYWGHAYTWIGWDELALWADPTAYRMLKARLRSAQADIPNKRIRASANPGGPGHHWVKDYFGVDRWPLGGHIFEAPDGSGMRRVFIRARLHDNTIGMENDPGYERRLEGVGSPQLVRALKEGDWSIVAGAYFPEFSVERHVVAPFAIPPHWARIRAMDWGSTAPFCVLWGAVSDGEPIPVGAGAFPQTPARAAGGGADAYGVAGRSAAGLAARDAPGSPAEPLVQYDPSSGHLIVRRGTIVVYREWYGWTGEPNKGLQLPAEVVGRGIAEREVGEKLGDEVLDPSAFARDSGPSIAERLGLGFRRADNSRVAERGRMGGWDQVRARLRADGTPGLVLFSTCTNTIRTLPALQHDVHRPEDVDTDSEDHAPDALRYLCMSRPVIRDVPKSEPRKFPQHLTINELIKRHKEARIERE